MPELSQDTAGGKTNCGCSNTAEPVASSWPCLSKGEFSGAKFSSLKFDPAVQMLAIARVALRMPGAAVGPGVQLSPDWALENPLDTE